MTSLLSLLLLLLLLICSPVSSFYLPRGLLFEEKTRVGSIPPSCHNKCNQCHPCMAVQEPTVPVHQERAQNHFRMEFYDEPSSLTRKYSNYKALGWKCHCNGHFFNP